MRKEQKSFGFSALVTISEVMLKVNYQLQDQLSDHVKANLNVLSLVTVTVILNHSDSRHVIFSKCGGLQLGMTRFAQ